MLRRRTFLVLAAALLAACSSNHEANPNDAGPPVDVTAHVGRDHGLHDGRDDRRFVRPERRYHRRTDVLWRPDIVGRAVDGHRAGGGRRRRGASRPPSRSPRPTRSPKRCASPTARVSGGQARRVGRRRAWRSGRR